ncbi:hypothetical protein EV356DRAFT_444661 [Viridothelium virens]|uniref:Zn(2)-C6 fungal-type domain-containing protein n=1 Tax=Viridothelium virens TaxID=1048519 RepID=A0A6A6HDS6_VIRVR|nr:hypothetical protein EV356DRAFT_444661 [Viridothelium virens]
MSSHDTSGPYPRRAHKKSRKGCKNCKARKVKCDEQRPLCGPCARHYANIERCEYEFPPDAKPSREVVISAQIEDPHPVALAIPRTIEGDVLDPFQTHPQTPTNNSNILLQHYLSTVVIRSFPFFNTKRIIDLWWPFLRADELLFNVVLYLSAVSLEALQQEPVRADSTRLMTECIGLLRARVADPSQGMSDETIIAVANLMAIEHGKGNIRSLNMHMEGLKRMVNARGGLDALRVSSPMAANIAFWMSMIASNQVRSLPLAYEFEGQFHDFPGSVVFSHVDPELYDATETRNMILKEANHMSHMFTITVTTLFQLSPRPETDPVISRLLESCRYAAVLHVFFPLCGYYPDPTLMVNTIVHDLKASLDIYTIFLTLHTDLVLWMFFVGGVSAWNMPERNWFVDHLVVITQDLEVITWEHVRTRLTDVVWYAVFCEDSFRRLWQEIEVKAESLRVAGQVP